MSNKKMETWLLRLYCAFLAFVFIATNIYSGFLLTKIASAMCFVFLSVILIKNEFSSNLE